MASLSMNERAANEGFVPLGKRRGSSFRGQRDAATDTAAELGGVSSQHFLKEQVLRGPAGTLPPRASRADLKSAQEGALYYSLRERIPVDLAATPGAGGQALRRVMLHGATIVFVTPGYKGKRFIYERAKELGVRSIIIDEAGSWAEGMVAEGVISQFVALDLERNSEAVLADCVDAVRGLSEMPAGVCTFCELSVPLVARLAETLGLPGPSSSAVDAARDKHRTRAAMKAAGLPSPACYRISTAADLDAAADVVGFPAVLKPLNGAASLGVKKVETRAHLDQCYADVLAEMRDTVVTSGALVKKDPLKAADADEEPIYFLMEEYLDGPEVDIDVVVARGEAAYARVVDNGPTAEPYFAETWGVCPSLLPQSDQAQLRDLAVASLKCCGFECGVFHVECKMTSRGPRLIEINARMGGGQVRKTHLLASGVDLVEETLFTSVGIPCNPHVSVDGAAVAYTYVTSPRSGAISGLAAAAERVAATDAKVVYCKPLVSEGAAVVGSDDALPDWLLDVMTTDSTADAALKHVLSIADGLDVPKYVA
mmetsp:Transcript_27274/g.82235  ORF Transcript_27274/g.82235 Transcript_27274/m.82235 type:complete len:541 (-) Transcript_27274:82-1704(-)